MITSRTTAPTPIATFFQAFIELRHGPIFLDRGPIRHNVYLATKTSLASLGVTGTHPLLRCCGRESSDQTLKEWPRPITLGRNSYCPGTQQLYPPPGAESSYRLFRHLRQLGCTRGAS